MTEFELKISNLEIVEEEYIKTWEEIVNDKKADYYTLIPELILRIAESLKIKKDEILIDNKNEINKALRIISEKAAKIQLPEKEQTEMEPADILETGLWILAESDWDDDSVLILNLEAGEELRVNMQGEIVPIETEK